MASFNQESRAATQREEAPLQSKYGGISPKKPLINKDHERAYFDSADWVLGKVTTRETGSKYSSTGRSLRPCDAHMPELTHPALWVSAARREQQQHDVDGPRRRAPQAQAAADGVPPASPSTARVHVVGVARRTGSRALQHPRKPQSTEVPPIGLYILYGGCACMLSPVLSTGVLT